MPATDVDYGVDLYPYVVRSSPSSGAHVGRGSTVRLSLGCPGCGAGSPGVPNHLPAYRVPRFIGRPVSAAYRWFIHRTLYFTAHLGRLIAGDARELLANYRVRRQRPHPGSSLRLGIAHRCCHGNGGSFRPTPLVVWGSQTGG
jgi:hypothetical protein